LTESDISQALALSSQAGWNQIAKDWETLIALAPDSSFALDCEGRLAATATLVCYGEQLAWLGMVMTKTEFRRRGFARIIVGHALAEADARGIRTVKLDATALGQPLYESFGFVAEQEVQRWSSQHGLVNACKDDTCRESDSPIENLDIRAFGANRHILLDALAPRAHPLLDGDDFAFYRDGLRASYLGPCISHSSGSAKRLIASALASQRGPWLWDLLPSNPQALALALGFDFTVDRRLVRMSRGAPFRGDESMVYAIAGFEFG